MRALFVTTAAVALLAPAAAHASGGGLTAGFGGQGATSPKSPFTYVAVPVGSHASVIQEIRKQGGAVDRFRQFKAVYGTPQVTVDGTMTGLSADANTLVLAQVQGVYPVRDTRLLVLNPHTFRVEQRIHLRGFHSVDAVSPDGQTIYLVHYTKPARDPSAYEVLAYDRADGSRTVIMDPDKPDEQMSGTPFSRVTSADGRWEYTLYDNPEEPFIHALNVAERSAECIDLPQLKGDDLSSAKLKLDGGTIAIGDLATVDPETQAVTLTPRTPVAASTPRPRVTATPAPPAADETSAWPLVVLGLGVLGGVAVLVARRRRRSVEEVVDLHAAVDHPDQEPALRE
jgi:LPXTG-motif cell wall-anchored protein